MEEEQDCAQYCALYEAYEVGWDFIFPPEQSQPSQ